MLGFLAPNPVRVRGKFALLTYAPFGRVSKGLIIISILTNLSRMPKKYQNQEGSLAFSLSVSSNSTKEAKSGVLTTKPMAPTSITFS